MSSYCSTFKFTFYLLLYLLIFVVSNQHFQIEKHTKCLCLKVFSQYIYIYIYIYVCVCVCVYVYTHIYLIVLSYLSNIYDKIAGIYVVLSSKCFYI